MTSENKAMREPQSFDNERDERQEQSKFRFGNYDLIRRIDVGGMGEVYLAHQRTAFDREVAIKIIRSDLVHDTTARKRFLREAEVNAHLKHEHILPLFEFGEEQGRLFLVTPYIAGGTLWRRLQAGPLSLSEVYQLFTALVKAVAYVHRRGVVHRDLKPNNILLDQEGNTGEVYVRLIDFGIASIQGMAASPPLTTAGSEVGTIAYMAPERLSGIAAPSNDIYSLGVILYQMLTGQLPSADHRISLPQPLEYVVEHSIAPNPVERFATDEDILNAFEHAYQYLKVSSLTPPSIPVPEQDFRSHRASPLEGNTKQQVKMLHHSDDFPFFPAQSARPPSSDGFDQHDYGSPTVNIDPASLQERQSATASHIPVTTPHVSSKRKPARSSRPRKNPILALVTLLVVFLLLATAMLFFFTEVQPTLVVKANVNFGPQVQLVKQVFHIKGRVSQQNIDVNSATIPVKTLSSGKDGSLSGATSGQQCLIPPVIDCRQVVAQADVDSLSTQLRQSLDNKIAGDIQQQIHNQNGTQVGTIQPIDAPVTSNPQVGADGTSVTVSIAGQKGQGAYIVSHDAQQLARLLLKQATQKLGPNYVLLNSLMQIGQPVVKGTNSNGDVLIDIAAAGDAQYQFPSSQLHTIQTAVKSMKEIDALAFMKRQPGIDAMTVTVHLSSGTIMPGDPQQIKIITISPVNFPPVFLPKVA
ncbi:MAG: serine/threonine protein kinase [Chloroflexota bacterium]|nr:serine/threonine protein kinase [Chloroflexota bacterium]